MCGEQVTGCGSRLMNQSCGSATDALYSYDTSKTRIVHTETVLPPSPLPSQSLLEHKISLRLVLMATEHTHIKLTRKQIKGGKGKESV